MKTRLLKKIRKQYSIVYYPNGTIDAWDGVVLVRKYVVHYWGMGYWDRNSFDTIEGAKEFILKRVKERYKKYYRKYKKPNYNGIKVWYNGK